MSEDDERSWWWRPCGVGEVMNVALPLVVSMLSFTVMQFCDRLFLTWYSKEDLAAVVPAGALSWTSVSLPLGIAMYATTFVAQYDGAGQPKQIGPITWQAIWVGLFCIPLYLILGLFAESIFEFAGHGESMVWREADYFYALSFGCGAVIINAAISSFYIGREKMVVVMVVNVIAAANNIWLDYLMIFGWGSGEGTWLPAQGISGAGWATTISVWGKAIILIALFWTAENRRNFDTGQVRVVFDKLFRLLRFGVPNGFQFLIEGIAITLFVIIIGRYSETASAATALAFSINMIVFVPVLGIGTAVTTLVGQQIGKQRLDLATRAVWTGFGVGMVYTGGFAIAYLLTPEWFLAAHRIPVESAEVPPNGTGVVEDLAIVLLSFVAAYCLFDTIQIIFVSAIKGAGDTMFVVWTTIASAILFVVAGNLGNLWFEPDSADRMVFWWWWCLTGWIVFLSAAYFLRFLQGKWRDMSVIEPDLLATELRSSNALSD